MARASAPTTGPAAVTQAEHDAKVKAGGSPLATATKKAANKKRPAPTKRTNSTKRATQHKASTKRNVRRARAGARQAVTAGTPGRGTTVAGLLFLSLGLVLLFNFLQGAQQLAGFLGGIQKALAWLASPTATIPFKET